MTEVQRDTNQALMEMHGCLMRLEEAIGGMRADIQALQHQQSQLDVRVAAQTNAIRRADDISPLVERLLKEFDELRTRVERAVVQVAAEAAMIARQVRRNKEEEEAG